MTFSVEYLSSLSFGGCEVLKVHHHLELPYFYSKTKQPIILLMCGYVFIKKQKCV